MIARGRQPSLPNELDRLAMGDAVPAMPSLADHVRDLTAHLKLAGQLLRSARQAQLASTRESFNQHQVETIFIPGERVRLWKRVPITRKDGSEEIASKLKLFNRVYEVVGRSPGGGRARAMSCAMFRPAGRLRLMSRRSLACDLAKARTT